MTALGFVCTKCGGGSVSVSEARPSLDDRYAVGFCERCTPEVSWTAAREAREKRSRPALRPTVPLIRAHLFDPTKVDQEARRRAERRLVAKVVSGKNRGGPPTAVEQRQAAEIQARWDREAEARRGTPS